MQHGIVMTETTALTGTQEWEAWIGYKAVPWYKTRLRKPYYAKIKIITMATYLFAGKIKKWWWLPMN